MPSGSLLQSLGLQDPVDEFEHEFLGKRETLELVRAYYKIDNLEVRKRVFDVIKALAAEELQKEVSSPK